MAGMGKVGCLEEVAWTRFSQLAKKPGWAFSVQGISARAKANGATIFMNENSYDRKRKRWKKKERPGRHRARRLPMRSCSTCCLVVHRRGYNGRHKDRDADGLSG